MGNSVTNRLKELRESRNIAAAHLAERAGVTRQTIYAIESGAYLPNTEVALRLARALEVTFEDLFALNDADEPSNPSIKTTVLSAAPVSEGQSARLCRVGEKWISVPVNAAPCYIPEADGVMRARNSLTPFASTERMSKRLLIAGCDPAMALLGHMVEQSSGVEVVCAAASSKLALTWLAQGSIHIAGMHLEDRKTGEFNLPFIRREFPKTQMTVVTFARWEEGLVIATGNPKQLRGIEDLARPRVKFINREPGSGSRALLDKLLAEAGMDHTSVNGYDRLAFGHLAAASNVAAGAADACLATRAAAQAFQLDFIPLHAARYDFAITQETAGSPAVQTFLNVLQRSALRRKLEVLAGYDTSLTGSVRDAYCPRPPAAGPRPPAGRTGGT